MERVDRPSVGIEEGLPSYLIADENDLDPRWIEGVKAVGLTAGASAPEELVQDLITALGQRFSIALQDVAPVRETVAFKLPRALAVAAS